jgi:hypothetical protein
MNIPHVNDETQYFRAPNPATKDTAWSPTVGTRATSGTLLLQSERATR